MKICDYALSLLSQCHLFRERISVVNSPDRHTFSLKINCSSLHEPHSTNKKRHGNIIRIKLPHIDGEEKTMESRPISFKLVLYYQPLKKNQMNLKAKTKNICIGITRNSILLVQVEIQNASANLKGVHRERHKHRSVALKMIQVYERLNTCKDNMSLQFPTF